MGNSLERDGEEMGKRWDKELEEMGKEMNEYQRKMCSKWERKLPARERENN